MAENIRISLIQTDLIWEDANANRTHFEERIEALEPTDLIILPEMFTTGFTMASAKVAEAMEGESMQWMQKQAKKQEAVICGSLIIEENGAFYNRLIWMQPDGNYQYYDKRHLFRMADEEKHFSSGTNRILVNLKGWNICPLICYDLRFPVYSRNRFRTDKKTFAEAEYDLLIYVANWPAARVEPWKKLLYARAIENQSFVIGLNRIGLDGKGIEYSGGSLVSDAKGEAIWEAEENTEVSQTVELNKQELDAFRQKFPVGMDADEFRLV